MDEKGLVMDEKSMWLMKSPFYGCKQPFMDENITFMDLDVICFELPARQQEINNQAFIVAPDNVLNAWIWLLFSASAVTDTGSKSFNWKLVLTPWLKAYYYPENGTYIN
jgi:hypothetical protein